MIVQGQLTQSEVAHHFGCPLSPESIARANQTPACNRGERQHQFKHFEFDVADRVFKPSKTGEVLHNMLYNSDLTGKSVLIMGTGCGVEPVVAAFRGAREVFACDIHPESVACAKHNFQRNATSHTTTQVHFLHSDLFQKVPEGTKLDLVCFDPPAVKVQFSNDPDQIRSSCTGASILQRFFSEIRQRDLLSDEGIAYIMISNTSDQEAIVHDAYQQGFRVSQIEYFTWDKPYDEVKTLKLGFSLERPVPTRIKPSTAEFGVNHA